MHKKFIVYLLIIMAVLFWGVSFVWSKIALEVYSPIALVFFRLVLSTILILLIAVVIRQLKKIKKKDAGYFIICAFFQPFLYFIGETFGLKYTSSSFTSVMIATIPLFVPIAAFLFLKTRIRIGTIVGIIISFIGVFVMMIEPGMLNENSFMGIAFIILAVFSAVGYSIIIKKLTDSYHPVTILSYQNIIGLVLFAPWFFIFELNAFLETSFQASIIYTVLKLAIFSSTLAFIFFITSVKILGVNRTSVFTNIIPVITAVFAYFVIDEIMTIQKIAGIVIVVFGVILSQLELGRFKK